MRKHRTVAVLLALALALPPGEALARSKGGFSPGGGSKGFGAPSRPAPSYSPPKPPAPTFVAPKATAPAAAPRAPAAAPPRAPVQAPVRVAPVESPKGLGLPAQRVVPAPSFATEQKKEAPRPVFDAAAKRAREEAESQRAFREAQQEKRLKAERRAQEERPTSVPPVAVPKAAPPKARQETAQPAPAYQKRAVEKTVAMPEPKRDSMLPPSYYERQRERAYTPPPRVIERHYHREDGGISPWFWIWMMDRDRGSRDEWVYHNRDRLSWDQMEELRRRDYEVDRRLSDIENRGVARDPRIVISGIDDKAPPAPRVVPQPRPEPAAAPVKTGRGWFSTLVWLFLIGGAIYLVAFRRYGSLQRRTT